MKKDLVSRKSWVWFGGWFRNMYIDRVNPQPGVYFVFRIVEDCEVGIWDIEQQNHDRECN